MSLRDLAHDRSYESNITNTKITITGAKDIKTRQKVTISTSLLFKREIKATEQSSPEMKTGLKIDAG